MCLVMNTIVDHSASHLACFRDRSPIYRVTLFPTSHHPTHLDRVSYKHVGQDVKADMNFMASDLITFVDGTITKTPSKYEISTHRAIRLLDFPWFIIPTILDSGERVRRGLGLGSLVLVSRSRSQTNCVFAFLVEESDRVWLRCRETGCFHLIRGIGVIAVKAIEASTSIRSRNQMISTISMSSRNRNLMRTQSLHESNEHHMVPIPLCLPCQEYQFMGTVLPQDNDNNAQLSLTNSNIFISIANQQQTNIRTLFPSSMLLLRLCKRHNNTSIISELQNTKKRRLHIIDDDNDSEGNSEVEPNTLLMSIVKSWNFCGVSGLTVLKGVNELGSHVTRLCMHFFNPVSFKPKSGIIWFDLFGQDVNPVEFVDPVTNGKFNEYRNTARAHVPLFNWIHGKYPQKPAVSDEVLADFNALNVFITSVVMPMLGFGHSGARFEVEGMSFLLQPPACGISQVLHTDDDPSSEIGEWISILMPCHDQRATVFMQKAQYDCFDKPEGVKPFVMLGDIIAWNEVDHMGSACQDVPLGIEVRVCLFAFVHVITNYPTVPLCRNDSEFATANRDDEDQEIIHFGPDFRFWRSGVCPIIRMCTVCKHGISSSYAPFAHTRDQDLERYNSNLLIYCAACVRTMNKNPVETLVCQWCRSMECLDVFERYPDFNCESETATVTDYVYQCLIDENTCVHGFKEFCPLDIKDYIFVLFSVSEVQSGCHFWLSFLSESEIYFPTSPRSLLETTQSTTARCTSIPKML